jgi:predicted kinase
MKKILYLLRGVSGSGKTFAAETLGCPVFSADDFFTQDGDYNFDPSFLSSAHKFCQDNVKDHMGYEFVDKIAVANTFTREWELGAYYLMAKQFGYTVISMIVENRHGGTNSHGVPESKVQKMRDKFEIEL